MAGPTPRDIARLYRAVRRGSPADTRWSLRELLLDLARRGTGRRTTLSMAEALAAPEIHDLSTAKVRAGDVAPAIRLPLHDVGDGILRPTGATFDLHAATAERPVALIFGSYT
jgi:hypothetical protein